MLEKANSLFSRYRFAVPGLLLLAFAALGADRASPLAPADETRSPSFAWGEIKPPAGQAGLSGIYHRWAVTTKLSVTGGRFITRAEHTYWCFFPDGRCYYSMPTEGLDNFNYDYVKGMNDLWCCTYRLTGDSGAITWGTGGSTVAFKRVGMTLLIARDSDVFELLAPCDGLALEGTYRREDWRDEISCKKGIRFSRDGTFVDEGFLSGAISTWWWADRGLADANFPPGSGTYRIARRFMLLYIPKPMLHCIRAQTRPLASTSSTRTAAIIRGSSALWFTAEPVFHVNICSGSVDISKQQTGDLCSFF